MRTAFNIGFRLVVGSFVATFASLMRARRLIADALTPAYYPVGFQPSCGLRFTV